MPLFHERSPRSAPAMPEGRRVYAIGDIHGRHDLLCRLLDQVRLDSVGRGDAEVMVILLGDLIDRGPDSARVVDLAMSALDWAELRVLRGNHEAALLEALDDNPRMLDLWINNGGIAALRSWGIDLADLTDKTAAEVCAIVRTCVPEEQLDWLRDLPLSLRLGDYVFVHAGVRPGVPLDRQSARDMLWIRDDFLKSRRDHGAIVVHGHTVTPDVDERANRIGLDTGAYLTGRLTAMGFEGCERWTIETQSTTSPIVSR